MKRPHRWGRGVRPLALSSLLLGCLSAHQSTAVRVQVEPRVEVVTHIVVNTGSSSDDTINPQDPRLARVLQALAAALGRGVDLEFDLSTLPRPRGPFFEALLDRHLPLLPRDAESLARRDPELLRYGARALRRIRLVYDGGASRGRVTFDEASGLLTLTMSGTHLVFSDTLSYAFERSWDRALFARYTGAPGPPESAHDVAGYFRFVTVLNAGTSGSARSGPEAVRNDPMAEQMLRVLPLAARTDLSPALAARILDWLADRARYLGNLIRQRPGDVASTPPDSLWARAIREYVAWLNRSWTTLPPRAMREVLTFVPLIAYNRGAGQDRFERAAWPGLDVMAAGRELLSRWIRAGHPVRGAERDDAWALYSSAVCPAMQDTTGRWREACGGIQANQWYQYVLGTPELRPALVAQVVQWADEDVLRTVLVNAGDFEQARWLWRALEPHEALWRTATRLMVETWPYGSRAPLHDELARLWREHPTRRDVVLYGMVVLDQPAYSANHPIVAWDRFESTYGSPVTRAHFEALLDDHGALGLEQASLVWPALARGFSRTEVLLPRLTRADDTHPPGYAPLSSLVQVVVESRDRGELAHLRAYLTARRRARPSEDAWLGHLLEALDRGAR